MNFQTLIGFIKKEFRQSLRDPVMQKLIFLAPLLQLTLFGFALNNETKNITLATYSKPSDALVQKFKDKAIASGWFNVVDNEGESPFDIIQSGKAEVAVVIGLESLDSITPFKGASIQILISAVNSIRAQAIESYVSSILLNTIKGDAYTEDLIKIETRIMYNPRMETSYFLIPALIGMIICLITVLLTSMAFTKEREVGTLETILSAPIKKWEIILGKALPSILMAGVNSFLTCSFGVLLFGVPFIGHLPLLVITILTFIIATVSIGIAISTISKTQQQAMMGSFLFLFPALLLSGLMFPVENMPSAMKILAELNPMTHFNYVMRNIVLKGGDLNYVFTHTGYIALIGIASIIIAFKNFKTTLN